MQHLVPYLWLAKREQTFWLVTYHMSGYIQQYLRLMSGYMQLDNDFNDRAINAPSFSKHHKPASDSQRSCWFEARV
jgi:hypothetical protein